MDGHRRQMSHPLTARTTLAFWLSPAIVMGLCLSGGCQPAYWYQEGRTFEECKADQADCRAELAKRMDRQHLSDYEERFMKDCMRQRGYELVREDDLPLDVKRQEPNAVSAVPWNRFYGVAGSLDEEEPREEPEQFEEQVQFLPRRI